MEQPVPIPNFIGTAYFQEYYNYLYELKEAIGIEEITVERDDGQLIFPDEDEEQNQIIQFLERYHKLNIDLFGNEFDLEKVKEEFLDNLEYHMCIYLSIIFNDNIEHTDISDKDVYLRKLSQNFNFRIRKLKKILK